MKKTSDKIKFWLLGSTTAGLLITTIAVSAVITQRSSNVNKDHILDDFVFKSSNAVKEQFASHYATQNQTGDVQISKKYWAEQLFFDTIPNQNDIDKRDFNLIDKKSTLLNAFRDKYVISFESYANDVEGELYLKVTLADFISKIGTRQNTEKIFTLKGFKKATFDNQKNFLYTNSAQINMDGLLSFNSFSQISDQYKKDNEQDKSNLIKSIINYDLPISTSIDYSKSQIEFKDDQIKIKPYLVAKVNFASADKLNNTTTLSSSSEQIFGIEKTLNFKNYFDFKSAWGSKITLSGTSQKLSELTIDQIKRSFDLKTLSFRDIKLDNVPSTYTYKISQDIVEKDNQYIFKYFINSSNQELAYVGELKINKNEFKN
ncbi:MULTISPECIES: MAG1430 family protein [unclassified Mycoplasma]|uniref:MAG1430 family protein n=1 Tax=unclassified Mycoplasma TaxID=2683645 RepID=UPI00211BF4EB|nr:MULTISPECIES: hypothetical protein [unclassified Mycoplasma]UUM19928.1 hypothetical protein NPA11_00610 [Mycoplasma sp. 1578d]UUM24909.1 hypothetical protein NPA12_00595 [Mycoplasma sp. 3686d]